MVHKRKAQRGCMPHSLPRIPVDYCSEYDAREHTILVPVFPPAVRGLHPCRWGVISEEVCIRQPLNAFCNRRQRCSFYLARRLYFTLACDFSTHPNDQESN